MNTRQKLMEDMDAMETAMHSIEANGAVDLWQNRLIWRMCKAIYDIIAVLVKLEETHE